MKRLLLVAAMTGATVILLGLAIRSIPASLVDDLIVSDVRPLLNWYRDGKPASPPVGEGWRVTK